jgi:hypothetical protein
LIGIEPCGTRAKSRVVAVPRPIVADVKIEISVAIQVGKCGRGRKISVAAQPCGLGHVFECAVAPVVVESVASPSSDEEIRVSVVVVVSNRDSVPVAPHQARDSRPLGGVFERAIASVTE